MGRRDAAAASAAYRNSSATDGVRAISHTTTPTAIAIAVTCQARNRAERDIGVRGEGNIDYTGCKRVAISEWRSGVSSRAAQTARDPLPTQRSALNCRGSLALCGARDDTPYSLLATRYSLHPYNLPRVRL